jgi:hypothetical protein
MDAMRGLPAKESSMKKSMYALAAAAALVATGAFAQADSPQFTGVQPGVTHPDQGGYIYGNSGWTPEQISGNNAAGSVLWGDGRYIAREFRQQYHSRFDRTPRDRDGDGVRNRQDRYPDDPRYR